MMVCTGAWHTPRGRDAKVFRNDRAGRARAATFVSARVADKTVLGVRHTHDRIVVTFANIATHDKDGADKRPLRYARAPKGFIGRAKRY